MARNPRRQPGRTGVCFARRGTPGSHGPGGPCTGSAPSRASACAQRRDEAPGARGLRPTRVPFRHGAGWEAIHSHLGFRTCPWHAANRSLSSGALIGAPSYGNRSAHHRTDLSGFIDFLEKPGCHLCEDALPVAARLARRLKLPLRRIDIDSDDQLIKEFSLRIPVIRLGSSVIAEGIIDYRSALAAARASQRHN